MPRKENALLIFSDRVFIYWLDDDAKKLAEELRRLGLEFEEKVEWCG